ncbi:MAG: hypothetical protein ACI8UP_000677 [Porticoccaceae bacterium]
MKEWEAKFAIKTAELADQDAAHDILHFQRVVNTAKQLYKENDANFNIVVPAAWLHDFVVIPKSDPLRSHASRLAAKAAVEYLQSVNYPEQFYEDIIHVIESHSFSANIPPQTLEAKIVQDADRLDALGAIGIARCFVAGGILNRPIYCFDDPFCEQRYPEDQLYTLDHFYKKLFQIAASLQTAAGRLEGGQRVAVMREFLHQLDREITPSELPTP